MQRYIAQLGLGYWGKNILRNLASLGVIKTACDINEQALQKYQSQYEGIIFSPEYDSVFEDPEIKAVVISTPAITHFTLAKRALLSGKDIYVEKPLALTVKEGQELVTLANRHDRILMVGHILQYHPAVKKLKELISTGALGKIQYIYSNRLNIGQLRTEENILWSFAPHDISVILMLVGEKPVGIYAMGGDYLNKGIYDTTITTLEFANGIKGHIFVSWLHPYKEQKLIVVGSQAMAVFDDVSKEKLFIYPHKINWIGGKIPVAEKAAFEAVPIEAGEPLRLELEHFIECIQTRQRPLTDGEEGLRVLRILELAEQSMRKGRYKTQHVSSRYYAHETAVIDEGVEIGDETKIWHFSHILKGSKIGLNCVIGQNVAIGPDVKIGNNCKIQNNVSVYKGVTLEDEVFCGPSCVFTNVYNPRAFIERKHEFLPTIVRRGATIGANATIVCGVTIGRYAMIGAGAVVKQDVADYAVVAGVPARQIGWACKCGNTLKFEDNYSKCSYCASEYELKDNLIKVVKE